MDKYKDLYMEINNKNMKIYPLKLKWFSKEIEEKMKCIQ
jgi:hypothetical protein